MGAKQHGDTVVLTRAILTPDAAAAENIELLESVLLDPNPEVLRAFSSSGELGALIPEWNRLTGPRNIQNKAHHFPLDEHTLKVVRRTKRSSYYRDLTDYQKFMAALSALLHDIDKNTGPERLYGKIPVDKLHPIKSAYMSQVILTRLGFPPKTLQRLYTLIHHHQIFGRLFVIYPQGGVNPMAFRKIAIKIRSLSLLECLLALSEGDIRGVQREDAYFTPKVADLLGDYAETVRELIRDFRGRIPLFPQHLRLDLKANTLDVAKSACFVIRAESWAALSQQLERLHWGGAVVAPYYGQLTALVEDKTPCAALVRFLPENIAYWGPKPETLTAALPFQASMDLFYGLLLGEPLQRAGLSVEEIQILTTCQGHQEGINTLLHQLSEQAGYDHWSNVSLAIEESWFEPSDFPLPVDPMLNACDQAFQEAYPLREMIGVVTRPILMAFYADPALSKAALPEAWQGVPVLQAQ
jgi:hypothetical protein